jgi:cytochrome c oxidase subunit 1
MIMGVAAMFGIFGGTFYWFPKMFGRMMNETLGKVHFYATFIGVYALFTPMHFLGIAGTPRRYSDFSNVEYLTRLAPVNTFVTHAAYFTAAAQLIFLFNLFWSLKRGRRAPENPWNSTTLEWTVSSPPPPGNFGETLPVVNHGPYEYSPPAPEGAGPRDFTLQTDPPGVAPQS